jgi:Tfp pilus assembly protein PilF
MRPGWPALFLALLLTDSLLGAVPPPPENERWLTVNAGDFVVYSSGSPGQTSKIAAELVRLQNAVAKAAGLSVRPPRPIEVYIFRDEEGFAPIRDALFLRRSAGVSGAVLQSSRGCLVLLQADAAPAANRVVFHEVTHQLLRNAAPSLPLWVHEGVAEYFSTFRGKERDVNVGIPVTTHLELLRSGKRMTPAQLAAVDATSGELNESRREGLFYAESWLRAHSAFDRGTPLPALDTAEPAAGYAPKPRSYATEEIAIDAMPMPRADVLRVLGQLLTNSEETLGDAESRFSEAIALDPKNALAVAGLAEVHELRGQTAAATLAFEKAIALGAPASAIARYGTFLLERKDVVKARQIFERAAQLDPALPAAQAGLGEVYLRSEGDPSPGIAPLEKALALAPGLERAALALAELYGRSGRRADAQRVFDHYLRSSANPETFRLGRESILFADLKRADDLLAAGKDEEAKALIRTVQAKTTSPRLKAHLDGILQKRMSIDQQLEIAQSAIAKADAGNFAEAVRILDELLPAIEDADFKRRVQSLRDDFAAKSSHK